MIGSASTLSLQDFFDGNKLLLQLGNQPLRGREGSLPGHQLQFRAPGGHLLGAEVAATALERVGGFPQSFRILSLRRRPPGTASTGASVR